MSGQARLREVTLACVIALSLAGQAKGVWAFTQEPVAPPSAGAQLQTPPQQQNLQGQVPQTPLTDPMGQFGKSDGTEVKIPGIGSVGTLPKLDFGLELLYGPKTGTDGVQLDQHGQDGDVQIKGTFTHKF